MTSLSQKARKAQYILVLFSAEYKRTFRFDAALRRESELVHELYDIGQEAAKRTATDAETARAIAKATADAAYEALRAGATAADRQALTAEAKAKRRQVAAKLACATRAAASAVRVYICNDETTPADIHASLAEAAPALGNFAEWWKFCQGEGDSSSASNSAKLNEASDAQKPGNEDESKGELGKLGVRELNAIIGVRPASGQPEPPVSSGSGHSLRKTSPGTGTAQESAGVGTSTGTEAHSPKRGYFIAFRLFQERVGG